MIKHNIIKRSINAEHVKKITRARVLSACVPPFIDETKKKKKKKDPNKQGVSGTKKKNKNKNKK